MKEKEKKEKLSLSTIKKKHTDAFRVYLFAFVYANKLGASLKTAPVSTKRRVGTHTLN